MLESSGSVFPASSPYFISFIKLVAYLSALLLNPELPLSNGLVKPFILSMSFI